MTTLLFAKLIFCLFLLFVALCFLIIPGMERCLDGKMRICWPSLLGWWAILIVTSLFVWSVWYMGIRR